MFACCCLLSAAAAAAAVCPLLSASADFLFFDGVLDSFASAWFDQEGTLTLSGFLSFPPDSTPVRGTLAVDSVHRCTDPPFLWGRDVPMQGSHESLMRATRISLMSEFRSDACQCSLGLA
jgi:hypothetical protein